VVRFDRNELYGPPASGWRDKYFRSRQHGIDARRVFSELVMHVWMDE
ncbi:MAG: hypothetical protein QOE68_3050, partial [Thermoanaerobaculia bacterium]|nr:hypothetical protein [Thermoanaerobaculia bacterium]